MKIFSISILVLCGLMAQLPQLQAAPQSAEVDQVMALLEALNMNVEEMSEVNELAEDEQSSELAEDEQWNELAEDEQWNELAEEENFDSMADVEKFEGCHPVYNKILPWVVKKIKQMLVTSASVKFSCARRCVRMNVQSLVGRRETLADVQFCRYGK